MAITVTHTVDVLRLIEEAKNEVISGYFEPLASETIQ